ncbi:MAG: FAD-dependent monooxygenase [Bryobacteraceae bacterium]|nr:FAD-dependent monooxygenase [Bryobacteraceae bacterium]
MFDQTEVLIAGAGPVGLFTALALKRNNVDVGILDTGIWTTTHSYALGLQPQSLRLLEEFGLKDRTISACYPVRAVVLYDKEGPRARIELDPPLAVLGQETLESLLEDELERQGVRVAWRHELASVESGADSVRATINRFEQESRGYAIAHTEWVVGRTLNVEVRFGIGADGHRSRVRRALGNEFPEVGAARYYAVFEFKTDADLGNESKLVLGEHTADVCWPLPGGFCRWSFELSEYPPPNASRSKDRLLATEWGQFPVLEEEQLRWFLSHRAPWFTGSVDSFSWRTVVRFERRLTPAFGKGRLWLAGDAAHLTGPAGMQSMNSGLFEGYDLAATLAKILRGPGSLADLDNHNARWTHTWRELLSLDARLETTPKTDPWVAQHIDKLMPCLPGHGPAVASLAAQLELKVAPVKAGAAGT